MQSQALRRVYLIILSILLLMLLKTGLIRLILLSIRGYVVGIGQHGMETLGLSLMVPMLSSVYTLYCGPALAGEVQDTCYLSEGWMLGRRASLLGVGDRGRSFRACLKCFQP